MQFRRICTLIAVLAAIATARVTSAAVITFGMPIGSTAGGQPVNASAKFTTSADQVVVELRNLQPDPTSVIQCLSGLQFTISSEISSASA